MLFNSTAYAIFLPFVFAIYWLIPDKYRWILLFVSSYYFYMSWNPKYVFLILFTTIVSYGAAIVIEQAKSNNSKKKILSLAAILCLGVLFFFKYYNFTAISVASALSAFSIKFDPVVVKLLLPVGISFYTFQTLSYVIDVYRGEVKAERHFGYYASFVAFFPQLVAGPIERTNNLLPQIKKNKQFDYEKASYGLKLMAWGFFKKIAIADRLSVFVSKVYDNPENFTGFSLALATLMFSLQIYCDFSGYSDIAIGTAKLLNIDLMRNFNSPYFSQSIKEFWGRWHISLSTWFRDYVYIPLGGNRCGKIKNYINLIITFLVSGLWHGANWTFVIWGGLHGVAQVLEKMLVKQSKRSTNILIAIPRIIITFLFCAFAWIFFVSNSASDACYVIAHLFDGIGNGAYLTTGIHAIDLDNSTLLFVGLSIALMSFYDYVSLKMDVIEVISKLYLPIRWIIYSMFVVWSIINFSVVSASEFIYFQF